MNDRMAIVSPEAPLPAVAKWEHRPLITPGQGTFAGYRTSEPAGATWDAKLMGRYVGEAAYDGLAAIVLFDLLAGSFEGVIVPAALAPPVLCDEPS